MRSGAADSLSQCTLNDYISADSDSSSNSDLEFDMCEHADMHAVQSLPDASIGDDAEKLGCRHVVDHGMSNSAPAVHSWSGGHIVVGTANCNGLEPKSQHAEQLFCNKRYFKQPPDIWAFTEVDGRSGTYDLRTSLGPKMCKLYDMYWSLRAVDHTGKPVLASRRGRMGGGVALLVRKSLNLQARSFVVPLSHDDMQLARGHILSLRLDPKPVLQGQSAKPWWPQRSFVVTVAYVPPLQMGAQAKWGSVAVRNVLLGALNSVHQSIQRLRLSDDIYPITLAHLNSPDNACSLPLILRQPLSCGQLADVLSVVAGGKCTGNSGAVFVNGSQLMIQRRTCSAALVPALSAVGQAVMMAAANCGMVPLDGVVRHREPTSFTKRNCRQCGSSQDCECVGRPSLVRRAVHDFILASADSVWGAFTGSHPLKHYINLRSRLCPQAGNRSWAPGIDHCVTSCRLFVGPGATQITDTAGGVALRSVPVQRKRVGRYRLPDNLIHRSSVLRAAAGSVDTQLHNRFSALACDGDDDVWQDSDELASRIQLAFARSRADAEAQKRELAKSCSSVATARQKQLRTAKKEMERALASKQEALRVRIEIEGSRHADRKRQREAAHVVRIKAHQARTVDGGVATRSASSTTADVATGVGGAAQQRLQAASKRFKEAKNRFKREVRQRRSWLVRWARPRAPALSWKLLNSFAQDDGLPGDGAAKLLQHLTDDSGSTIASTRDEIIAKLLQHQRQVFQVEQSLPQDAENRLADACVVVSAFNCGLQQVMPHLHGDSVVAQTAADPLAICRSWCSFETRRDKLLENLSSRLASCNAARLAGSGAFAKHNAVLQKYSSACAALQVPFELSEIVKAMSRVRDGGAGVDGVEPALLMGHDRVHDCEDCARAQVAMSGAAGALPTDCHSAEALTRLFNANRRHGRLPTEWRCHRCLLHYKGKGSDPHCVDNYRGLGVDQALLKLFSLVMEERLMTFVEATGALSHTQGGFLRQRGTPEQVITLSEVVRSALKRNRKVYLEFLDIRRAYDTVLHPILWQRCIDIGIGGPFLAMLQEIYYKAEARLDINGTLLAAVPLECGVLQGNPLSPLLFNIYLDGAVREFEERVKNYQRVGDEPPLGLSFPRRPVDGVLSELAPARLRQDDWIVCADALDRLTHLFYADDGALMAHSRQQLQIMSDWICELFGSLGLRVNARKTKCMLILPGSWSSESQQRAFADAYANQIHVGSDRIDWVQEFDYLGVRFNYRWTWQSAWKEAARRASVAYHRACCSGWDERGTLDSLLTYAQGKIFCRFTYIAAITGCGGRRSSRYSDMAVAVQKRVMRHIGGYEFADADIVLAEAGVWDLQSSIDMWLLRFWCKVSCSSHDSMAYRAMLLSLRTSTAVSVANVDTLYASEKEVYCQSWAQHLIAAAARFDLDTELVRQMRLSAVLLVQVQLPSAAGLTWSRDFDPSDFSLANLLEMQRIFQSNSDVPPSNMRLVATGDGRVRSAGTNCWPVPAGSDPSVRLTNVLRRWTVTLKTACYSALRRRGNACRQSIVRIQQMHHVQSRSSHFWWAVFSAGSIRQPYWWATDTFAARRLLRLRACQACNEGYIRQRPYTQVISKDVEITLPRINDRCRRACYMCPPIDAAIAPDVFWPETVEHMLITCSNVQLAEVRERLRRQLTDLATRCDTSAAPAPDFRHDTALLTAFMLASGTGSMPTVQSAAVAVGTPEQRRDGPQINFDPAVARSTSAWISALTERWVSSHRTARGTENPDVLPGGQLVSFVLRAVAQMFTVHNHVCRSKTNDDYRRRVRDPVPNRLRPSQAAARRVQRAARKAVQTAQRRRRRALAPMPRPPCRKRRGGITHTSSEPSLEKSGALTATAARRAAARAVAAAVCGSVAAVTASQAAALLGTRPAPVAGRTTFSDLAAGSNDPPGGVESAARNFPPVARPPSNLAVGGLTSVGAVVNNQCNCDLSR